MTQYQKMRKEALSKPLNLKRFNEITEIRKRWRTHALTVFIEELQNEIIRMSQEEVEEQP